MEFVLSGERLRHTGGTKEYAVFSLARSDGAFTIVLCLWNKVGGSPNSSSHVFDGIDAQKAINFKRKKLNEKMKNGYHNVTQSISGMRLNENSLRLMFNDPSTGLGRIPQHYRKRLFGEVDTPYLGAGDEQSNAAIEVKDSVDLAVVYSSNNSFGRF